jgi:hypothetical protein
VNDQERSEFRAFVREHHPDRGGDPEAFVAGVARFGTAAQPPATAAADGDDLAPRDDRNDDRGDADDDRDATRVEASAPLPFVVRVGVALIRTWHHRRRGRVE